MFPETTAPPWQSFPRKWPVVVCKVVGLTYEFPSAEAFQRSDSTVCQVELQLLKFPPDLDRDCQFLRDYLPRPGRFIRDESQTFKISLHRYVSCPPSSCGHMLTAACDVVRSLCLYRAR